MPSRPASWMYGFGRLITECPASAIRRSRALPALPLASLARRAPCPQGALWVWAGMHRPRRAPLQPLRGFRFRKLKRCR